MLLERQSRDTHSNGWPALRAFELLDSTQQPCNLHSSRPCGGDTGRQSGAGPAETEYVLRQSLRNVIACRLMGGLGGHALEALHSIRSMPKIPLVEAVAA